MLVSLLMVVMATASSGFKNTIIIFIDDLGYGDTGPYGVKDIPTPNIDRLAKEGVVFTQGYVLGTPCCPSRASLMMGMYPQKFGKYGMSRGLPIPSDKPTLAAHMKANGFQTGHIGKWDIGAKNQTPLAVGFMADAKQPPMKVYTQEAMEEISKRDKVLYKTLKNREGRSMYIYIKEDGTEGWSTEYDGDMAVDFINQNHDKPFFLYFSPEAVHSVNNEAPERLRQRTTAPEKRRALAGQIVSVDDQVGKILDALEKYDLRKNTLVIFSSDNGPNPNEGGSAAPYKGGKFGSNTQYDGWVHVPMILSLPGVIPEGETFHGLASTLDFYATITALNQVETPEQCDGVNLIPYLQGKKEGDPNEYIFWLNNDPEDLPHRHLIAARWKDFRLYKNKETGIWQLFNMLEDPRENRDIAASHPEILQRMIQKYEEWCETHVPPPATGFIQKGSYPETPQGYGLWKGN